MSRSRLIAPRAWLRGVGAALALALVAGCDAAPSFPAVRDVRPTTLEVGDTLVVELDPAAPALAVGEPVTVAISGRFLAPGAAAAERSLELDGRASAPRRVVAPIDARVASAVGGRGVIPTARVAVRQRGALVADSSAVGHRLQLFPSTVRSAGRAFAGSTAPAAGDPSGWLMAAVLVGAGLIVLLPVPLLGGLIVVWERKISGYIQSRPGPNRVGPNGWFQFLADGVKLIVKEDIIPSDADPLMFRASPFLVFAGVFLTFVALPFSPLLQIADLDIGILYILSVTSIVVVGVIMGGWASNSKWSLLGGMRSAAQIISYELPAAVAVLSVVIGVGSLSTQELVRAQGGLPWEWHVFANPFAFVCFFIFFISALAEGNRTPFDLPEAESELVSGYNTEYSGFRFACFALAEWVNLIVLGAVVTTVFLGGWQVPFVAPIDVEASLALQVVAFSVFALKTTALIFVTVWVRWTLPRFRVDHMMTMCWKYFLPASLVSLIGSALWTWLLPAWAKLIGELAMFAVGGVGLGVLFLSKVNHVRKTTEIWELRGA
jgi:NADH-quinone oxidoreductase subunit H